MKSFSFFVKSRSGAVTSDRFGANFPRYVAIPSTVYNSSLEVGDGISQIPCVLIGSGRKPSADHIWPNYVTWFVRNTQLPGFSLIPLSRVLRRTASSLASWSFWFFPYTKMSSTIAATPGNASYVRSISFWNTSCAEFTPNGSRVNWYLPNGVLNVVRRELFLSSFTCQYRRVASSTVNTRAPCSFAAMSSQSDKSNVRVWELCWGPEDLNRSAANRYSSQLSW